MIGGTDHPRGCGENAPAVITVNATLGSPPRMRGKLEDKMRVYIESRITPADAGKTCRKAKRTRFEQDHPRGCGENHAIQAFLLSC